MMVTGSSGAAREVRRKILALVRFCERERGGVMPARNAIATALRVSGVDVKNALARLDDHGCIRRVAPRIYRVVDDSMIEAAQ